ncbi:MAG: hypothetical protein WD691_04710 [Acidimicrobiales bacterium]
MNRKPLKVIGATVGAAMLFAACGSSGSDNTATDDDQTSSTASAQTAANGSDSPASGLRAGLTSLLQEHVYLAGITTGTALSGEDYTAAAAALEVNTQGLQDAISSVYGDAGGKQFGDLWRKHIGFFVDYTVGKATSDDAKVEAARTALDGYRSDFGAFIESATKGALPKDAVAEELSGHVESLFAAIDAQAAKDPSSVEKLRMAANHMPMTAAVLAAAITGQFPDKFDS